MNKLLVIVSISLVLFASCDSVRNSFIEKNANYTDSISQYENLLFAKGNTSIKVNDAIKLAGFYRNFAINNKKDSLAADYLFKSADIFMNMNKANDAIESFNMILEEYPEYKKAPSVLFLKAFIYEDQLDDLANAEKYYKIFLEKYPNSDFADDAEISLNNLGKTPEQLIEEFEKMNN
jgi:TolA-binding protein